jgi:small-conductance mechanosensitive channel
MSWRVFLAQQMPTLAGIGLVTTLCLLGFLRLVLKQKQARQRLIPPAVLLAVHFLLIWVSHQFEPRTEVGRFLGILALLALIAGFSRVIFLFVVDWMLEQLLKRPISRIIRDIIQGSFYVLAVLVLLRAVGVELGSLLTTSAILTAVIGFSLQETVGNLVAGLAVQAERPFEVGDWVQFGETNPIVGQVVEINWRATKLRTKDLVEVAVPNGIIAKLTIQNFRRPSPVMRRQITFQGPYEVAPNIVRTTVIQALRSCPNVLEEPTPTLWTQGFGESGIDYSLVFFLRNFEKSSQIESDVRDRIWYALQRASVGMPYPIREVRLVKEADGHDSGVDAREGSRMLQGAELFRELPTAVVSQLAECGRCMLYGKGETIVFEGEQCDELFVIASGEVAVVRGAEDSADEVVLAKLGSGELFGELGMLSGTRAATVRAEQDTRVMRIGYDDLKRVVESFPGLEETLTQRLAERRPSPRPSTMPREESGAVLSQAVFDRIRRFFTRQA